MFSSSTKSCLYFLSIFILFQLNNGCVNENMLCGSSPSDNCCRGLICQGEFLNNEILAVKNIRQPFSIFFINLKDCRYSYTVFPLK